MTKLQKGIIWGCAGITYVFGMNIVLAWATTGYLDGAVLGRMAIMLLPVLAAAAVLFPYAGVSRVRVENPESAERRAPAAMGGGVAAKGA